MTDAGPLMAALCSASVAEGEKKRLIEAVTPADITGPFLHDCAQYLLERAVPLELDGIDVCGTGGDGAGFIAGESRAVVKTFNISTAVSFVAAAGGVAVVKHGNRAISSRSGSNDVLEALGIQSCGSADDARRQFEKHGLCFVAAPAFHPVLGSLAAVRKSIGHATFFNLLGPLCNPACAKRQLIGAFHKMFLEPMATAAQMLQKTDVMIVHGDDGLDEISTGGPTQACRLAKGQIRHMTITPEEAGLTRADIAALQGGSAAENARIIEDSFSGKAAAPAADIIALNAAAAFMLAGLVDNLRDGVVRARGVLSEGLALKKLKEMRG